MAAGPEALSRRLPVLGVFVALGAQVIGGLRGLRIGGMGAGLLDDFAQYLRVLQHRAGAQMVVVERLAVVIGLCSASSSVQLRMFALE